MKLNQKFTNLNELFPADFNEEEKARARTLFLKLLSKKAHHFYGGKMQTIPKCSLNSFDWFNVWYTPGVSAISTAIRENNDSSFAFSNRGNLVAVVSDSTRVLGDGDCTAPGGLGVMEGKAMLMKYLGAVDAVSLCIDSRNKDGQHDPQKIIEFVKMVQSSFGAINLEDISQPNCFPVLDELRESCDIPVWHDDAQGTACVTLAGLINALKLAGKKIDEVKIVLLGAGAANTTIARLILAAGGDKKRLTVFDSKGNLHAGRRDIEADTREYRKWELCRMSDPDTGELSIADAMKGADVLIALSKPGPDTVKREWIRSMAPRSIVFCCANPVPEIWPYAAKEEGAFIVATGRGDFPNQVNNSVCFPGILKGALLVRAKKISDGMILACAHSIALFSEKRGITPDNIIATMEESDLFPQEAADVAMQAIEEGLARVTMSREEVYGKARDDIEAVHRLSADMQKLGHIKAFPPEIINETLRTAIKSVRALDSTQQLLF
jgi:malate dehydrogenase (oxaloacetate-decarboxylating)